MSIILGRSVFETRVLYDTGTSNISGGGGGGGGNGVSALRYCRKCRVFIEWPVNIGNVSKLRVKDLRFYLGRHYIDASTCTGEWSVERNMEGGGMSVV